jgi:hypothetical protein
MATEGLGADLPTGYADILEKDYDIPHSATTFLRSHTPFENCSGSSAADVRNYRFRPLRSNEYDQYDTLVRSSFNEARIFSESFMPDENTRRYGVTHIDAGLVGTCSFRDASENQLLVEHLGKHLSLPPRRIWEMNNFAMAPDHRNGTAWALLLFVTAAWIERRLGVRRRRFAEPDESVVDMAAAAAAKALAAAGEPATHVDLVVLAYGHLPRRLGRRWQPGRPARDRLRRSGPAAGLRRRPELRRPGHRLSLTETGVPAVTEVRNLPSVQHFNDPRSVRNRPCDRWDHALARRTPSPQLNTGPPTRSQDDEGRIRVSPADDDLAINCDVSDPPFVVTPPGSERRHVFTPERGVR